MSMLDVAPDEQADVVKTALSENPSELLPYGAEFDVIRFAAASSEGSPWCEAQIVAVVARPDGKFVALEGGCDYTGWDCQSGLDASLHHSVEAALRDGITASGRDLLAGVTA